MTRWTGTALVAGAVLAGVAVSWVLYPTPLTNHERPVPALRGVPLDQALAQLNAVGLRGREAGQASDPEVAAGSVAWQVPARGTVLPESALVRLTISSGPPSVLVPNLSRLDLGTALEVLEAAGLSTGAIDSQRSRGDSAGIVIRTTPDAGKAIRAGAAVNLTVSSGPRSSTP